MGHQNAHIFNILSEKSPDRREEVNNYSGAMTRRFCDAGMMMKEAVAGGRSAYRGPSVHLSRGRTAPARRGAIGENSPLKREVALVIGGVLIGVIAGKLLTPGPRKIELAEAAPPPRIERACGVASGKTAVIVVHGQSNAGNYGIARYSAREAVDNFDPSTGKCFAAADPLLGAYGTGGNFATRLGDMLIQAGRYDRVIILPLAVGGASVSYLSNEGSDRITNAISKLKAAGLAPTHFLFQQGEQDAASTTPEQYVSQLHQLVKLFRAADFNAPFYLSRSTKCDFLKPQNSDAVRAGQLSAIDDTLNIRQGPDTDTIGNAGRYDGCHMNEVGTIANAALWAAFIR